MYEEWYNEMLQHFVKKEECVFDEISMITMFNSENDQGQCKEEEIMIRMEFPGYEKEIACWHSIWKGGRKGL